MEQGLACLHRQTLAIPPKAYPPLFPGIRTRPRRRKKHLKCRKGIVSSSKISHCHWISQLTDDQRGIYNDKSKGNAPASKLVGEYLGRIGVRKRCKGHVVMEVGDEKHRDDSITNPGGLVSVKSCTENGPNMQTSPCQPSFDFFLRCETYHISQGHSGSSKKNRNL